jgi:hypothetical protein
MTPILGNGLLGSGLSVETTSGPSTLSTVPRIAAVESARHPQRSLGVLCVHAQTPLPWVWRYQSGGSFQTAYGTKHSQARVMAQPTPRTSPAAHRRLAVQLYWRSQGAHTPPSFRFNDPDLHCEHDKLGKQGQSSHIAITFPSQPPIPSHCPTGPQETHRMPSPGSGPTKVLEVEVNDARCGPTGE